MSDHQQRTAGRSSLTAGTSLLWATDHHLSLLLMRQPLRLLDPLHPQLPQLPLLPPLHLHPPLSRFIASCTVYSASLI